MPNSPRMTTALAKLPELPEHYNPVRALSKDDRNALLDAILSHYENGASIYDLAEKLGVSNTTIYRQLVKNRPEDWKEVTAARYQSIIERCENEIKTASSALAVTRAREELANARWMLERLDRRTYGQDQGGQGVASVQININLRDKDNVGAVIDQQVSVDT